MLDRLGIRDRIADRLTLLPFGVEVIQAVADGRVELGVSQSSEISLHPGVSLVGRLPEPYALVTPYAAASLNGASDTATRFVDFLQTNVGVEALTEAGFSGEAASSKISLTEKTAFPILSARTEASAYQLNRTSDHVVFRRRIAPFDEGRREMKFTSAVAGIKTACIVALSLAIASPSLVQAQNYPNRPIRMIVPFSPGGAADTPGRMLMQKVSEALGQQVVFDNRPGAGGTIGAEAVAKAAPDGYTLLLISNTHLISASLYKNLAYDAVTDFAPVLQFGDAPNVLVVNPSLPAKSVRELIALAKANPGNINYASSGNGSSQHLFCRAVCDRWRASTCSTFRTKAARGRPPNC